MKLARKNVIYTSLGQVFQVLESQNSPEVNRLIELGKETLFVKGRHITAPKNNHRTATDPGSPFVVVEGLDGTGKTTLTRHLSEQLRMKLMSTPPKQYDEFRNARDYFDDQNESIRRAYYSLGNYLAAFDVVISNQPVVMDRFWHSTAAYALAHLQKYNGIVDDTPLTWPKDLLQPDLVIFLQVSEKERLRRHSSRADFTNTKEEQTLAEDSRFRQNLVNLYRGVVGPPFLELTIDGEQSESETKILTTVVQKFPNLLPARSTA